jgi:hypothetical protein
MFYWNYLPPFQGAKSVFLKILHSSISLLFGVMLQLPLAVSLNLPGMAFGSQVGGVDHYGTFFFGHKGQR